jgi:hypothetical protein|tara:strand:- start:175 stop:339 length:165 start_codon:yes stop_codon:yes gene_type:complete
VRTEKARDGEGSRRVRKRRELTEIAIQYPKAERQEAGRGFFFFFFFFFCGTSSP